MKAQWLLQKDRPELVVFFNGWGMDPRPVAHLGSDRYDVLELHAYASRVLPREAAAAWPRYQAVHVVAWSLGVWMAQTVQDQLPAHTRLALAVNGTLQPVHDLHGIAPRIFRSTLSGWSAGLRERFYANMFNGAFLSQRFLAQVPERTVDDQRQELEWLASEIRRQRQPAAGCLFNSVLISKRDVIFLSRNQVRFWSGRCPHRILPSGHFPFFAWRQWEELLAEGRETAESHE